MIDSENKPYLRVSTSEPPYYRTENFNDASGCNCSRQVLVYPESSNTKDYNLAASGWHKKLEWQQISRKDCYFQVEGSLGFEKRKAIVLSTYTVDIAKEVCFTCGESKYQYTKNMPSGCFKRCFKCDITGAYFLSDALLKSGIYRLKNEKELTVTEAKRYILNGTYCADLSLRLELGI